MGYYQGRKLEKNYMVGACNTFGQKDNAEFWLENLKGRTAYKKSGVDGSYSSKTGTCRPDSHPA